MKFRGPDDLKGYGICGLQDKKRLRLPGRSLRGLRDDLSEEGNYQLNIGLACQTVIEPEIYLAQLPFVPAIKRSTRLRI
jgi:hypothetical protein